MDIKKHIGELAAGVIVVLGIGGYMLMVPGITEESNALRAKCEGKATEIERIATSAGTADALKTARHVTYAKQYAQEMDKQAKLLKEMWATKAKLEVGYKDVPTVGNAFDFWLGEQRKALIKTAEEANLILPEDIDKLLFREPPTDDKLTDINDPRSRPHRLRYLAVYDEVVKQLTQKPVAMKPLGFDPKGADPQLSEKRLGVLQLEKVTLGRPTSSVEVSPALKDALARAGNKRTDKKGSAGTFVELPYTTSVLDVQFVAPVAVVPAAVKALETSSRWLAVATRVDFMRHSAPYPSPTDKRVETAGPNDWVNTYYQEGPVRVQVTLELYEHDAERDQALTKVLSGAAPDAGKTKAPAGKK